MSNSLKTQKNSKSSTLVFFVTVHLRRFDYNEWYILVGVKVS